MNNVINHSLEVGGLFVINEYILVENYMNVRFVNECLFSLPILKLTYVRTLERSRLNAIYVTKHFQLKGILYNIAVPILEKNRSHAICVIRHFLEAQV